MYGTIIKPNGLGIVIVFILKIGSDANNNNTTTTTATKLYLKYWPVRNIMILDSWKQVL